MMYPMKQKNPFCFASWYKSMQKNVNAYHVGGNFELFEF